MKVVVAAFACLVTVTILTGAAQAQVYYPDPPRLVGVLPPYQVLRIVQARGFEPISRPMFRGRAYVVRALNADDVPIRVFVDARSGAILGVAALPTFAARYATRPYDAPEYGYGAPPQNAALESIKSYEARRARTAPNSKPLPLGQPVTALPPRTPLPRARPADAPTEVSAAAPAKPDAAPPSPAKVVPAATTPPATSASAQKSLELVPPAPLE